jgi:hypothetical protein
MLRRRRRSWVWLLAAGVLFGCAAWLMSRKDPERPEPAWQRVDLPRHMKHEDRARAQSRRLLPELAAVPATDGAPEQPARPRDPVLAALPSEMKRGVVVVEANAIRHSPVGELMLECLLSRDDGAAMANLKESLGFDPLEAVDRIALADDTLVISGHFGDAKWKELFPGGGRAFGQHGTIYSPTSGKQDDPMRLGVWRNQVVVLADNDAQAELILDRIEGRGLHGPPVIDESMTYGEIYGVISATQFADMLPADQKAVADRLRGAADRIELHVDTRRDVGVVADIRGPSPADARDLGRTLGAALAVGRLKAQAEGNTELAELMELARVMPGESDFRLELGLPLEFLQKHLQSCVDRNKARRARTLEEEP